MSDHDYPDPIDEPPDVDPDDIDLEKIPRELWPQALAPLHRSQRGWIVFKMRDPRLKEIAGELAFELDSAETGRASARQEARGRALRQTAGPLPSPDPAHATTRQTVQVNIRLRVDDHERLTEAARAVGLRPTTLARALVLNGAARVLRDERAGAT